MTGARFEVTMDDGRVLHFDMAEVPPLTLTLSRSQGEVQVVGSWPRGPWLTIPETDRAKVASVRLVASLASDDVAARKAAER